MARNKYEINGGFIAMKKSITTVFGGWSGFQIRLNIQVY